MKIKIVDGEKTKVKFEVGDVIRLNGSNNDLRFITKLYSGYYAIDLKDGRLGTREATLDGLIDFYNSENRTIETFEIEEIILKGAVR